MKIAAVATVATAVLAGSCNAAFGRDDRMVDAGDFTGVSVYGVSETVNPVIMFTAAERVPLSDDVAHVRQILVMHSDSSGGIETTRRSHAEAFERATQVRDMLNAGGSFGDLARSYSDCPSGRLKGGDIGIIRKGETLPAFEQALFDLDDNGISSVIETNFGFHILQRLSSV